MKTRFLITLIKNGKKLYLHQQKDNKFVMKKEKIGSIIFRKRRHAKKFNVDILNNCGIIEKSIVDSSMIITLNDF